MGFRLCAFSDEAGSSLAEQIAALKRNGIGLTEIRNVDGVNVSDFTLEKAREYADRLKENGIEVWSVGSPIGKIEITDDFGRHLEVLEHIIELAKIFGTDRVRVFSFFLSDHGKCRDEVLRRMKEMVKLASSRGISLCHENERGIYGDTAGHVADILDNVPGLKCVFDPANFVLCDQDMDEAMDLLLSRTEYFHIKDALYSGEIVPAGHGDGRIEELLSKTCGKVLTLEPHLKAFSGYSAIDAHELKNRYTYESNAQAFDAAADALKAVLKKLGYVDKGKEWIKRG